MDTSTPAVTAGVVSVRPGGGDSAVGDSGGGAAEVRTLAAEHVVDARRHGETLAPLIERCLASAGVAAGGLAAVVAGLGPGPFTGLRVGLVTAAAMSDALGIPSYGVCSLDAIAASADKRGQLLVATDARRREIYWATYLDRVRVSGPAVDKPAEVAKLLGAPPESGESGESGGSEGFAGLGGFEGAGFAGPAAGGGAALYAEVLGRRVIEPTYPTVAAFGALAADRVLAGAPGEALTPLYLRRPDAAEPGERKRAVPAAEQVANPGISGNPGVSGISAAGGGAR